MTKIKSIAFLLTFLTLSLPSYSFFDESGTGDDIVFEHVMFADVSISEIWDQFALCFESSDLCSIWPSNSRVSGEGAVNVASIEVEYLFRFFTFFLILRNLKLGIILANFL